LNIDLRKTSHDYINENKKVTKNKKSFKYSNNNAIPKMNLRLIKQKAEKQR
jgi:hypothetical protein